MHPRRSRTSRALQRSKVKGQRSFSKFAQSLVPLRPQMASVDEQRYACMHTYIYMHVYTCTCMYSLSMILAPLYTQCCRAIIFQGSKVIPSFSRKGMVPSNKRRCTCTQACAGMYMHVCTCTACMYMYACMYMHVHVSVGCHNRLHPQHSPCGLGSCDLNIFIAAADAFSL